MHPIARFFAFLVALWLCASSVVAEESSKLYPVSRWTVSHTGGLAAFQPLLQQQQGRTPLNLNWPQEILAGGGFNGLTVTDGDSLWTILSLVPKRWGFGEEGPTLRHFESKDFRNRLGQNSIAQILFPNGRVKFLLRKNTLFLISPDFPVDRFEELDFESLWKPLRENYEIALRVDQPGRILYPELPAERDDEGAFLKNLRKERSKEDYKDSGIESTLFGLRWDDDRYAFEMTNTVAEGTPEAEKRVGVPKFDAPFGLGGFIPDEKDEMQFLAGHWRLYHQGETNFSQRFIIKTGTKFIPEGERKDDGHKHNTSFSFNTTKQSEEEIFQMAEKEGYTVEREGELFFLSLDLPEIAEDAEDADDYRVARQMNEAARDIQSDLCRMLSSFTECDRDWTAGQAIDYAFRFYHDEKILVAAMSTPPGETKIGPDRLKNLVGLVNRLMTLSQSLNEENKGYSLDLSFTDIETTGKLVYRRGELNLSFEGETTCILPFFLAQGDDLFGILLSTQGMETVMGKDFKFDDLVPVDPEDFTEQYFAGFRERVETSRRLKAEGLAAPANRIVYCFEKNRVVVEEKTEGRAQSFSMSLDRGSLGWVANLAMMFGGDTLRKMLPGQP